MSINMNGAGPLAREWVARDEKHASTSYTRAYPLVVDHAQGSELWDVDGKRYVDFMAGIAVHNVGHRHPYVVEKVKETIDKFWHICHSDFYVPQAIELAEKIQEVAPMSGNIKTYFGNSGTEAVEAAIKLSMHATGRNQFIGFRGAFHGRTLGSLSFTASKYKQQSRFQTAVPVHHVPFPNAFRPILAQDPQDENIAETVINYIKNVIFETTVNSQDVAAVLIEPIQGEGGYVVPAPGFFSLLRELCNEHGILLIADEIQTGAGRTGTMWTIEQENVEPDILVFAKGIGSGIPIGGIAAREKYMTWKPGNHGSTYGGNPVACASAIATIEVIQNEGLLDRAKEVGKYAMQRFRDIATRHHTLGDVRGRGMMIGLEFVRDRDTKERAPDVRDALAQFAFENGLLTLPCGKNTMRFAPPLNIGRDLLDEGFDIFERSLAQAEKAHPYKGKLHSTNGKLSIPKNAIA